MSRKLKITFNSPLVLTFSLTCAAVTLIGSLTGESSTALLFSTYGAPFTDLLKVYPYFDEFRKVWLANKKKDELLQQLVRDGVFIDYVRETIPRENVDDYDVLSYIGYEIPPLTKDERIDRILSSGYLDKYTQENLDIIRLLLNAYRTHDIDAFQSAQRCLEDYLFPVGYPDN